MLKMLKKASRIMTLNFDCPSIRFLVGRWFALTLEVTMMFQL